MRRLFLIALMCAACAAKPVLPTQPVAVKVDALAKADNSFGIELLKRLADATPGENVFISPSSIAIALQMTMTGAAGETYRSMSDALKVTDLSLAEVNAGNATLRSSLVSADPKVKLAIANSLWLRKGVKLQKSFVDACRTNYNAQVSELDFAQPAAIKTINNWASANTNGRITEIISQLTPQEILVLVNAIYFKGTWTDQFKKDLTAPRDFYLPAGAASRQMMRRDAKFRYKQGEGMQAVVIPYGSERMSMYVFLPDKRDGLADLLSRMDGKNWDDWFSGFSSSDGEVVLPKFRIEYGTSLTNVLKALGMAGAFLPSADFSKMVVPPATAAISDVIHKTFVEVNEEGTEAAAVTAVKMLATSMPSRQDHFSFVVDHPFVCAIRDDTTGAVLFVGAIYDPKQ